MDVKILGEKEKYLYMFILKIDIENFSQKNTMIKSNEIDLLDDLIKSTYYR